MGKIIRQSALPALRMLVRPSTLAQIPRLFREGFGPAQRMFIVAHNNRELARMVREQIPVAFVASWLRSGSTWMCYLLCDILLQNEGMITTTELPFDRKRIVMDQYARLLVRREPTIRTKGYLIKTHDLIPELQARVNGDPAVRQCKYLYLYRTPEDTLVSLCHYYRREKWLQSRPGYDLACRDMDLFCLEFIPGWVEHVSNYLNALDEGLDVHLVSYDQLLRETTVVLSQSLSWLGIPHTEASVAHAHSNMEFGKLQAVEAKTLKGGIPFFRRGREGAGKQELKPETLSKIRDATRDLFARANERLARQSSRNQPVREGFSSAFSVEPNSLKGRALATPAPDVR
jgi:hypothetical protein